MDAETTVNADSTARPAAPALASAELAPAELAPAAGDGSGPLAVSQAPTIYDVARAAGVSIASVSRVLNGRRNPRPETRDRVLQAVAELGFVPDGAARALSVRLKEVAGVIIRLPWTSRNPEDLFADEEDSLQFPDMINRGIAEAAQRRGFDILVRSVDLDEHDPGGRILSLARKSDGIIVHDRVLDPDQLEWLGRQIRVVTMADQEHGAAGSREARDQHQRLARRRLRSVDQPLSGLRARLHLLLRASVACVHGIVGGHRLRNEALLQGRRWQGAASAGRSASRGSCMPRSRVPADPEGSVRRSAGSQLPSCRRRRA